MPFQRIILSIIIVFLLFLRCNSSSKQKKYTHTINQYITLKQEKSINGWHLKDIEQDSLPGISLEKAYNLLKGKKSHEIITIAIIDTELDISHPDLKNQIWINADEIPNNNIDDDNNGYVDDIHGWNYIGTDIGDTVPYTNYEYTRIIRKYQNQFENINSVSELKGDQSLDEFIKYQRALKAYNKELSWREKQIGAYERMLNNFIEAEKVALSFFPNKNFSTAALDSLYDISTNEELRKRIQQWKIFYEGEYNLDYINEEVKKQKLIKDIGLNINFNDRYTTKDDPNDITDVPYGNNNVQGTKLIDHATMVASVIAAERNNSIGVDGINNNVRLMSLGVAVAGNEFDKDIALAIRYAVDNGAKIINMSIGKEFSMYPEWIIDAIKYAEKKDVLVITSSGNEGYNIDFNPSYPNDNINEIEAVENFINVSATSYNVNSKLVYSASNYGKEQVDLFAPGVKIFCFGRNGTSLDSGTSFSSAIISGVASLLFSYYPNLTAAEVKQIIMESGVSFDIMVLKPYANGEKRDPNKVPFSSLSKSGKIVNAYNALLMAEEVSKKKKKN